MPLSPSLRTKALILLVTVAGVCALDQVTKALALKYLSTDNPTHLAGPLYLVKLVHDSTSFSNIAQSSLLSEFIRLLLIATIAAISFSTPLTRVRVLSALVAGGILSNALDHWIHPAFLIVDFITVGTWTFNIADVVVTLATLALGVCFAPYITHPLDFVRRPRAMAAKNSLTRVPLSAT